MKIISWNIAGGCVFSNKTNSYNKEDLDYFTDELQKENSDVICLQETHTPVNKESSQAKIIADKLGYGYLINHPYKKAGSHIKKDNYLSISIISKYPITENYFYRLPDPDLKIARPDGSVWVSLDVGFLTAAIDFPDKKIIIGNCHLIPFHYFRRDLSEDSFKNIRSSIVDYFKQLSLEKSVIAGDFNFADMEKMLPGILPLGYREVFPNTVTTPKRGQQDHLLLSQPLILKSYSIKKLQADHYMCVVETE